ncbi:thioesterase II family protein [Kitasatospora sp. NPDC018058]|uniref:thioesterase II family protein n=1 Tax=Kitasatospora sp. NPDC018058 TaxID=3364025 RepID=UPI0037C0D31A
MTQAPPREDLWIRRYHPSSASEVRVVCFPHAGGSASSYYWLSAALPSTVEMLGIQYPGRQDRRFEPPVEDAEALVGLVLDELRAWSDRPLVLFGHSMGALLAFEVARRLEALPGREPLGLVVSGRAAPAARRGDRSLPMTDDAILAELRTLSGTDPSVLDDAELRELVVSVMRTDYRVVSGYTYRPGPALRCPVAVLTGEDDPRVTEEEAAAWQVHTSGEFSLRSFPGGHFYFGDRPREVAAALLDRVASFTPQAPPAVAGPQGSPLHGRTDPHTAEPLGAATAEGS